jgi:hypothetical protein
MADTLAELRAEADAHAQQGQWGRYRNARYTLAEGHRRAEHWRKAGPLYVEVMILDLQGATSGRGTGHWGFRPAYATLAPAPVHEAARFTRHRDLEVSGLRSLYTHVADRVWRTAFPRSQADVWKKVRPAVVRQRARLRLNRMLAQVGRAAMLPDKAASAYRTVADNFALVRRVEQLLAPVRLPEVSPARRSRAVSYLSGVEVAALTARWQGTAARRTGELMWALGAPAEARNYLQQARRAVGPVERVAVEGLLRRLRNGNVPPAGM